jgi:uncharacterized coiled-coil protein SlyX
MQEHGISEAEQPLLLADIKMNLQQMIERITALEQQAAVMDARITALEQQAAVKDARITALEQQVIVKDARITALEQQVIVKDTHITALETDIQSARFVTFLAEREQILLNPSPCRWTHLNW